MSVDLVTARGLGARLRALVRVCHAAVAAVLVAGVLLGADANATTPYAWRGEFGERIENTFFTRAADGALRVDAGKVAAYRESIERKRRVLTRHYVNYETIEDGKTESEAREEVAGRDTMIALDHIVALLDRLAAETDPVRAFDTGAEILMVEYATRSFTEPIGSVKIPVHVKNLFDEWRIPKRSSPRRAASEASNLVDPATGEFYTPEELAEMVRAGFDLSLLDPPHETAFWRKRDDISEVDIVESYLNGGDPMHEGIVSEFPPFDGAVFEFDEAHKTQSKPKLDVYYLDEACRKKSRKKQKDCREKIKLKFGMETHADPPANALLGALGFNIDVSMHLKNARVNLGKGGMKELEREWIGYFDRQRLHTYLPLERMLKPGPEGRGKDEQGDYVVFTETVAELKPDALERIGLWPFESGMAAEAREARGLFVFNAWIGNADMKDEENNKLILREQDDGSMRMYLTQQDLGHAMGWVLPERPQAFPWNLVETDPLSRLMGFVNGTIELDYVNLQDAGLERTTTYADAKWMVRLIAQLTRKQIEDAIGLGVWPGGIPQLLVEKLIHRRNQLVEVFGLADAYGILPVDRHVTTADGSVVDGELTRSRWPEESPNDFDYHWRDGFVPVGHWLVDRLGQGLQAAISAVDVINPGNIEISGRLSAFPRILVNLTRQVVLNPEPEGAWDQYIVFDSVTVGVRAGVGYIGSVEGTLLKRFAMAYPVAKQHDGIYGAPDVLSFLLPPSARKAELPEKYVLFRENAYKTGFRVSTDHTPFLSPFGVDGDQNWVWKQRSVIDRRGKRPLVWVDAPRSIERDAHMFFELAVLQIPFLGGHTSDGRLAGKLWTLDSDALEAVDADGESIFEKVIRRADFDGIDALAEGPPRRAEADFESRDFWWNLFFANGRRRASEQLVRLRNPAGEVHREERQIERRSRLHWFFLDNGESQEYRVTAYVPGGGAVTADAADASVAIHFDIDDLDTHSDEFADYYRLIRLLGSGEPYLSPEFRPTDWEVSGTPDGRWTRLLTQGSIQLEREAIDRLVAAEPERHWPLLARNLGLTSKEMDRHRRLARASVSKDDLVKRRSLRGRQVRSLIRRSRGVLDTLAEARAADSEVERMRLVVKALFRSAYKTGETFEPVVLASLLEQCGVAELAERGALAVESRVSKAFEDEHNLPERRDILGRIGKEELFDEVDYRLFPLGAIDLWRMLDWVSETE